MRVIVFLLFVLSAFCLKAQTAAEAYIAEYDSLAIEVLKTYKIPASLVLGIGMHETGAGTSKLCRVNNNHFGMKARFKSSKTKSGYAYKYRKFDTDEVSYLHFGEIISNKKYYSGLKGNMDYMKWLKAMKAAHYAVSSSWIRQIDAIIKRYDLTSYDDPDQIQLVSEPQSTDTIPVLVK